MTHPLNHFEHYAQDFFSTHSKCIRTRDSQLVETFNNFKYRIVFEMIQTFKEFIKFRVTPKRRIEPLSDTRLSNETEKEK